MRVVPLLLGCLVLLCAANARAQTVATVVDVGVGAGSYIHRDVVPYARDERRIVVPFRELGVSLRRETRAGHVFGAQLSERDDDEGMDDVTGVGVPRDGSPHRYRAAMWAGHRWDNVQLDLGLVLSDYLTKPQADGAAALTPLVRLAMGNTMLRFEIAMDQADRGVVSAENGGLGRFAMRGVLRLSERQEVMLGVGSNSIGVDDARLSTGSFATWEYSLDVGENVLHLGGYVGDSHAAYIAIGRRLGW